LYSPYEHLLYDDDWYCVVNELVSDTILINAPDKHVTVTPDSVLSRLSVWYACETISSIIAFLLSYAYIPDAMKSGIIITLHKGGNKRRDDPSNYRVISYTSIFLKLFEMVLLERCKYKLLSKINKQQGGFQEK
jgi:hypothetical protein